MKKPPIYQILTIITSLYITLPIPIFAIGWLRNPIAVAVVLLILFFVLMATKELYQFWISYRSRRPFCSLLKTFLWIVPAGALLVLWLSFSGVGGLGFQNPDYQGHNPLLLQLILQNWPLTIDLGGNSARYVYYLAYYLPAGLIGKITGKWLVANAVMFIWTLFGVWIAFAWFVVISRIKLKRKARRLFGLALLFCLAGGLDLIGAYIIKQRSFNMFAHVDFWAELFQYSSNTTLIYWVPQHTVAIWLVTGVTVFYYFYPQNLKYLGTILMASMLWSPFGVVAILPYLILLGLYYLLQHKYWKYIFNIPSLFYNLSAMGVGIIIILYLSSNQFKYPIGWAWQFTEIKLLITSLVSFWLLEFALLAIIILSFLAFGIGLRNIWASFWDEASRFRTAILLQEKFDIDVRQFCLFVITIALLFVLPLYRMGIFNDLVMRGSIPYLFIFWAFVSKVIFDTNKKIIRKYLWLYIPILVIILLGFFSSVAEIARSVKYYQFGPPKYTEIESYSYEYDPDKVIQRAGVDDALFYRYFSR
jgi:hypothetical protein